MNDLKDKRRFWTPARAAFAASVFVAAVFVISGCTSNDTANLAANQAAQQQKSKPKVTITSSQGAPPAQPPPQQGGYDVVPPEVWDAEIEAVNGGTFRLSDFKDKVVVLDIWATWCGPCRLEIPHLVDLSNEFKGKGVEVIGLTTESPQTDADKVHDFAKEFQINYKLGWATANVAVPLMNGRNSIPQTFVIAPGGRIINRIRGYTPQIPAILRAAIDKANEKTGD